MMVEAIMADRLGTKPAAEAARKITVKTGDAFSPFVSV